MFCQQKSLDITKLSRNFRVALSFPALRAPLGLSSLVKSGPCSLKVPPAALCVPTCTPAVPPVPSCSGMPAHTLHGLQGLGSGQQWPAGCAYSLRGAPSVKGGSRPPREAYYLTHRRSTIVASAACLNSWPPRVAPTNGRPFRRSHSPGAGTDAGAVSLHDTAPASVPVPGECDLGNGRPLGDFGAGNFQIECNGGAGGQGSPPPTLGLGQRFNHRSLPVHRGFQRRRSAPSGVGAPSTLGARTADQNGPPLRPGARYRRRTPQRKTRTSPL